MTNKHDKNKTLSSDCTEDCACGCKEGKECTCNEDNCSCGEDCTCDEKHDHDCGCGGKHDHDCGCGEKNEHDCGCDEKHDHDCGCGGKNEHCHCKNDHEHNCGCENKEEKVQAILYQMQAALMQSEQELKKAKDEIIDSQRLAMSYKKDLERYKERNKDIEAESKANATEWVASQLIPVLDQFSTALANTAETPEKKGFKMIEDNLKRAIDTMGIVEIEAMDKEFDSNLHNAISKVTTKDKKKNGIVTAVYQKGYKFKNNDKIIRYAMVEVSEYIK